jgi:hypothetical protein
LIYKRKYITKYIKSKMPVTYVPPAFRPTALPSTKKKEPKKEFAIDQSAFPTLATTIKKSGSSGTPISFSSAAAKKVEAPVIVKVDVLPGWVHIRRNEGKIQYKHGKEVSKPADESDAVMSRIILKNRIAREQYDRDREIDRMGDLSEYYGQPTLVEIYENDLEITVDDSESSEYSENDYE